MPYEEKKNLFYLHVIVASLLFFTPIIHLPLTQNPYVPIKLTFLKILSVFALAIWADLIIRKGEIRLSINNIDRLILGLLLIFGFSLIISTSFNYSKVELIRFINLFFLFFLTKNLITNKKLMSIFAILAGFYVSLSSILEYYKVFNYKYTAITHLHGIASTIGNPNFLGEYLNIILPIAVSCFIFEKKRLKALLYFIPVILIGIAIMLTFSRASFFTFSLDLFILLILVSIFFKNIERKNVVYFRYFLVLIFFSLGFLFLTNKNLINPNPYPLTERIYSTFNTKASSTKQRLYIWKISALMIKEKLLTGYGLGTFASSFPLFQGKFLIKNKLKNDIVLPEQAHNEFIGFFVETGILGFILFSIFPLLILYYGLSYLVKNDVNKPLSLGITIGCFSIFITSLVGFPFHITSSSSTFFILLGLLPVDSNKNITIKFRYSELIANSLKYFVIIICVFFIFRSSYMFICKYYQQKAKVFFSKKNIEKAILMIDKAQEFGKNDDEVLYYNAKYKSASGNMDEAVKLIEKAVKINRNNLNHNLLLCEIYTKMQFWDKLLESAKYASILDPNNALFYYFIGLAYYNKKMYNDAISYFEQGVQIQPNHSESYLYLGICYNKLHKYNLTISSYKNCISLKGNYLCHYNLGNTYLQLKNYELAISEYKESIKLQQNYPLSHANLGLLYFQLKEYNKAERELRKALRFLPDDELIKRKLEEILNVKNK